MEVITAKTAGFCFGVMRAVEKVDEQVKHGKKEIINDNRWDTWITCFDHNYFINL